MISRDVILAGFRAFVAAALPDAPESKREALAQRHADMPDGITAPVHAAIVAAVEADRNEPWAPQDYPVPSQRDGRKVRS